MRTTLVYLAGPLTQHPGGTPWRNVSAACHHAETLRVQAGIALVPIVVHVPHLSMLADMFTAREYHDWLADDLAILERCDVLYRFGGESPGAEREVRHAMDRGIPVFTSLPQFTDWLGSIKR